MAVGGRSPNADIEVTEEVNPMFLFQPGVDLRDIVEAVNQVGASPSSLIAILEALKALAAFGTVGDLTVMSDSITPDPRLTNALDFAGLAQTARVRFRAKRR